MLFFLFCEICKEFVLQCTQMNKTLEINSLFTFILLKEHKNDTISYLVVKDVKLNESGHVLQ